jgi:anaerobic selenocysteine-containing dehydrogenase
MNLQKNIIFSIIRVIYFLNKNNKMKNVFHAKTKLVDIQDGEEYIILINESDAWEYGITPMDKVELSYKNQKIVLNADLSNKLIKSGEV